MSKIAVIYYSLYGHIGTLAKSVAEGVKATGATVDLYQIPETLSPEVLTALHAPPRDTSIPDITPAKLTEYDGFIFGIPTRYGRAVAQFSQFFDQTGGLWAKGALLGKTGAIFAGSAGQHGGAETTVLTTLPFFTHHGIAYVPLGYPIPELNALDHVFGGSPWGAASISGGDGSRSVQPDEAKIAETQGKAFATFTNQLVRGKSA